MLVMYFLTLYIFILYVVSIYSYVNTSYYPVPTWDAFTVPTPLSDYAPFPMCASFIVPDSFLHTLLFLFLCPSQGLKTLPYLTQPPSQHKTPTNTSLENKKLKLHLYHTLSKRLVIKYGIVFE